MSTFQTRCISFMGELLYSDEFTATFTSTSVQPARRPDLNRWEQLFLIGSFAAITRITLSIIHMGLHAGAAALYRDKGHLYHVIKGGAECFRGCFAIIPVFGPLAIYAICTRGGTLQGPVNDLQPISRWSFFMVKIRNPDHPDPIDLARQRSSSASSFTLHV
jgi:hypothetical protein